MAPGAGRGAVPGAVGLVVLAAAALALRLTLRSLRWPLVHDAPIMHYVASRLLEGAVPYRDLFDMNLPGVYLAHALALGALGRGDLAFRLFDLAALALAVAGLLVALRGFGPWGGAAAATLFWLYHVSGGAWLAGQRELLLSGALAWLAAGALAHLRSGRPLPLGLAALALGAGVWIKPHAVLLAPLLGWLAWRSPAPGRAAIAAAAGFAAPVPPVVAWLASTGALPAFRDLLFGYLLPLYSRLGRVPLGPELVSRDYGWPVLAGLPAWALLGAVALRRAGALDRQLLVLAAGLGYGGLHFWIQGRGWEYHLYPLALFAVALGAAGLGAALAARRRLVALALAAVLAATAGGFAAKGLRNVDAAWIAAKVARVRQAADALRPVVAAGRTVQVLDTTDGGVHALYLAGARQPTRFLYDFHFYHDVDDPYVRRLRAELLDGLRARPPGAILFFERGWPDGGYERLDRFPELRQWLVDGYRLREEGPGYRLYAARSDR